MRKATVLFMLGSFGIVIADKAFVSKTFPKPRIFVGLTIAFLFVGVTAEFAPELSANLAGLVFVGLLLTQGVDVLAGSNKALAKGGK